MILHHLFWLGGIIQTVDENSNIELSEQINLILYHHEKLELQERNNYSKAGWFIGHVIVSVETDIES